MEGLRKGSLFPFPEKGRGEGTVPRRFLHPAGGPGQEGPLSASGGAVLHGFRLPGRDVSSFAIRSSPGRSPSSCKFCLLPDDRWAICPCARTPYPAGKSGGAGHAARVAPETGGTPAVEQPRFHSRCGDPVPGPSHAGRDAPAGPAPAGLGNALERADFQAVSKKNIAFCSGLGYGLSIVCGKWRHGAANPSRNQP